MVRVHVRPPPPSTPSKSDRRSGRPLWQPAGGASYLPGASDEISSTKSIQLKRARGFPRARSRDKPPFRVIPCGREASAAWAQDSGVQTVRAHGGCLGGGRRRRTRQAAISSGETHAVFDPEVSEWGNPASHRMPRVHEPNSALRARPGEVKHLSSRRRRRKTRFRK